MGAIPVTKHWREALKGSVMRGAAARHRRTLAPPPGVEPDIPELPVCSLGQAAWEDDVPLQWELRLVNNAEVGGFVGKAVEA